MVLHWRPVGPEPEQTYWQRRALVALAVLVPLLVLATLLGGGDDAPDRVAQRPAPSASPSPATAGPVVPTGLASPTVSPTPAVAACAPAGLSVDAAATEDAYAAGGSVKLVLKVSTKGTVPCTIDLGASAVELLIYSGADRIWSSDDCSKATGAKAVTLQPGKPDVTRVTWSGKRSLPKCAGDQGRAQPGTYRVTARIGETRVDGTSFRLT